MRAQRRPWLLLVAVLWACDDGPQTSEPVDMLMSDGPLEPDLGRDQSMPPDPCADQACEEMGVPDAAPECRAASAELPGDEPLDARSWRVVVQSAATRDRWAPDCGEFGTEPTRGSELSVRFTPDRDGEHLIIVSGRYAALYAVPACEPDPRPEGCIVVEEPIDEGVTRAGRLDFEAGVPFDLVADSMAGERAGPATIVVYPPVTEGGDCSPIGPSGVRPSCIPGHACLDDTCTFDGFAEPDVLGAWSDGQTLRVKIEISDPRANIVEAMWTSAGGRRAAQLLVTYVDRSDDGQLLMKGYIEDKTLAAADEITLDLLDADERVNKRTVPVEQLELLGEGDPCDELGIVDACRSATACVEGLCQPLAVGLWRSDDVRANLSARMPTIRPDGLLLAAVIRSAEDDRVDARWQPLPRLATDSGRRWGLIDVPTDEFGRVVDVRIEQQGQPPSLPYRAELERLPTVAAGERCDLLGIEDRCRQGSACLPSEAGDLCQGIDPPVITSVIGWFGAEAIGIKISFADPQNDVVGYVFRVTSRDGELRDGSDEVIPLTPEEAADGQVFVARPAPWQPALGDAMTVRVVDAQGLWSEDGFARLEPAPPVGPGVPCDPLGGLNVCADPDAVCVATSPAELPNCQLLEVPCPDWRPALIDAPNSYEDTNRGGPDRTAGICGGLDSPEVVFLLEAQQDARLRAEVSPPGAVVYVRRFCRFPVPERSELACDETAIEFDTRDGEIYYLFVDGPGEGIRFSLDLNVVDALGPVDPEPR